MAPGAGARRVHPPQQALCSVSPPAKRGGWPEALLNLLFEHPYNFFIDTVQPMLLFNMGNEPQYFNKKVI